MNDLRDDAVIDVKDLRKSYGDREVVCGVNFAVYRGEVFALLGPNGAGKTTTVEILEGYRRRSSGDAHVLGVDPQKADSGWRDRVGIVLQNTGAFEDLTPLEVVRHFAKFYTNPLDPAQVLELVGLEADRRIMCSKLSGGQKRRLDVAVGIVGNPELVFLDEPTSGFDPQARRQAWAMLTGLVELGTTVLLTTHYLDEAEALADRAAIIANGVIVASGPPRELGGRSTATAQVRFTARGRLAGQPLPCVEADAIGGNPTTGDVVVRTDCPTAVIDQLTVWARALGEAELPELTVTRPTLEDIYLQLTTTAVSNQ